MQIVKSIYWNIKNNAGAPSGIFLLAGADSLVIFQKTIYGGYKMNRVFWYVCTHIVDGLEREGLGSDYNFSSTYVTAKSINTQEKNHIICPVSAYMRRRRRHRCPKRQGRNVHPLPRGRYACQNGDEDRQSGIVPPC
jgi:hypothetical protein